MGPADAVTPRRRTRPRLGQSAAWQGAPAVGAGGGRFDSGRPDQATHRSHCRFDTGVGDLRSLVFFVRART